MGYLSRVDCARAIMRVSALGLLVFSTGCASMMVSRREPVRSEIKARVDLTAISATEEGGRFSAELKLTETSRSSNSGKKPLPSEVYLTSQDPRIQELIDEGWVDTPKALRGVDLSKPNPLAPETYDPSEIMRLKRQDMPAFIRLQRQLRLHEFAQAPVSITWSAKDDVWVLTARKEWRHYHTSSSLERGDGEWQHGPFGVWAPPLTRQAYLSMNVASAARAIAQPCCRPLGR